MWSWMIIALISLTCLFCFISVVQLELKKPSAKVWIILTCCLIVGVVSAIMNLPSTVMQNYSYESKKPQIEIKELKVLENKVEVNLVGKKVVVKSSELNVWADKSFKAKVVGTVKGGEILKVTGALPNHDWLKIQTGTGLTGWVVKSFVEVIPEESEKQKEEDKAKDEAKDEEDNDKSRTADTGEKVRVKTSELFVRADSNYDAKVIGTVKKDDILKVLDAPANLNWVKIQTDAGLTGWVSKSLVEFLPEASKKQEDSVK